MLYFLLEGQRLPWLMAPLLLCSFVLVTAVLYTAMARLFAPSRLRGEWPAGMPQPAREPGPRRVLSLVGELAQPLGLLGTVVSILVAFKELGATADGATLLGTMSSALLTTAAGLVLWLVALLADRAHRWEYER